jgi:hypothetical protein
MALLLPKPSEQGETHDLPTPLDTKPVRHRVAQTQPLSVRMHEVRQIHWNNTEGEAKWISTAKGAVSIIQHNAAIQKKNR